MNKNYLWSTIKSKLNSVQDLAEILEVPIETLFYLSRHKQHFYKKCPKDKPDGRVRVFFKPQGELKKIQSCIHKRILQYVPTHPIIHSYRKHRDQLSNASVHERQKYILKFDRKDFFPSVTPEMVNEAFQKLGFCNSLAKLLTAICNFDGQLPQGAPTSNVISNLIQIPLAKRMASLGKLHKLNCSIYGDDVYVSGSERVKKFKNLVRQIIEDGGFHVNEDKSQVMSPRDQHLVTGVVVNEKPNVSKSYRRDLRALLCNCQSKGIKSQFDISPHKAKLSIQGRINHVMKFNKHYGALLQKQFQMIDWGK